MKSNTTYSIVKQTQHEQIMCTADSQQKQLNNILKNFQTMFLSGDQKPTITNKMECHIDTGNHDEPIYSPSKYYHPKIQKQIDKNLKN